jgi:hypothetical protein
MVVSAEVVGRHVALRRVGSTKLASPDHQSVVE